jgi:hypothetical protein
LPAVGRAEWAANGIDRFILERLERDGLTPSPAADREALARRVHLDLLGLPPEPEDADRFVADGSIDAYERLLDRVLASPRYGERQARHWLDAARYADTNGYEKDLPRTMWRYRDWVIDALNRDLPFDRFATEQLAGDLLPGATLDERIATGFHRNTMINEEGGVDQEEYRYLAMVDRVDATATIFLGLTMSCAQCHDHKYDPLSQRDYYRFLAFFNGADEPAIEAPTAEESEARRRHHESIAQLERELFAEARPGGEPRYAALDAQQPAWEEERRRAAHRWSVLAPEKARSEGGAEFEVLPDGSLLAVGPSPQHDTYTVESTTALERISGIRLEVLTHPSLPGGGPGRGRILGDGNFVLSELRVTAAPAARAIALSPRAVKLAGASADYSQKNMEVEKAIDGDIESGWAIDGGKPGKNVSRTAVFETAGAAGFPGGTRLVVTLAHYYVHEHTIGRLRISVTGDARPLRASGMSAEVEDALVVEPEARSAEEREAIRRQFRREAPELAETSKRLADLEAAPPAVTTALVFKERPEPRPTHIHVRGEYLSLGEPVEPGVPAWMPPLAEGPRSRLALARWLFDSRHPLTARVAANRAWQRLFGRGLVKTPEDFGTRSEPPSHPELLDWLAGELERSGWGSKRLDLLIAASSTYRQDSSVSAALFERDRDNVLLARGARFRLDAECVRDVALAASGLLSARIGGPSVFPPQPGGLSALSYGGLEWKTSSGEDRFRRGLYTFWKRTNPYPMLSAFDAPLAERACVRRERSNTPLQALFLLNDEVFVEASRALARRALGEAEGASGEGGARLKRAFRLATGREPDAVELEELRAFLDAETRRFLDEPDAAAALALAAGEPRPEPAALAEIGAWTLLARALLNLDETMTRS